MDLRLLAEGPSFRLVPASVHGILWLQTHFESEHWELLAEGHVIVSRADAETLMIDSSQAGLTLNPLPSLTPTQHA